MRKRQGFVLRSVCGEQFLIAEGEENIDFGNLVSMNESSVLLWNSIADGQEFTVDTLADILLSEYEFLTTKHVRMPKSSAMTCLGEE